VLGLGALALRVLAFVVLAAPSRAVLLDRTAACITALRGAIAGDLRQAGRAGLSRYGRIRSGPAWHRLADVAVERSGGGGGAVRRVGPGGRVLDGCAAPTECHGGDDDRRKLHAARGGHSPGTGADRRATHGSAASGRGEARAAAADAHRGERAALEPDARDHRKDEGGHGALAGNVLAEGAAAGACLEVLAERAAPKRAASGGGELFANVGARRLAGVAVFDQRRPRLEHERLHLHRVTSHDGADVRVRQVAELGEHQRRALLLGKLAHVVKKLAQVGALLDFLGEPGRGNVLQLARPLAAGAKDREALVAGDRVEPGLELELARVRAHRVVCGDEGLLDGILRLVGRAEQVPAEGQDRPVVAVEDDLEGGLVATADVLDEPRVRECAEQAARPGQRDSSRNRQGLSLHRAIMFSPRAIANELVRRSDRRTTFERAT
jgi:hypothetical protein